MRCLITIKFFFFFPFFFFASLCLWLSDRAYGAEAGSDENNHSYESYLNRLYKNYYQEPISEEQWKGVVKDRESKSYNIQKGDTLWDISRILFGDPFYWPKLWSLNSYITNPHFIREGNTLQIYLGSTTDAPSISLEDSPSSSSSSSSSLSSPSPSPSFSTSSSSLDDSQFMQEGTEEGNLSSSVSFSDLPPSLPSWHISFSEEDQSKEETIRIKILERNRGSGKRPLPTYVSRISLSGKGKVVELGTGGNVAAVGEYIYIQLESGQQAFPRSRFHVLKQERTIPHPRRLLTTAKVIRVEGEVEMVSLVSHSENIYRARVVHSLFPISKGSIVRSGSMPEYNSNVPNNSKMQFLEMGRVRIMDGNVSNVSVSSKLHAPGSIVFLDAGSSNGLREGQFLGIFANQERRLSNLRGKAKYSSPYIGNLKVVQVEPYLATALILYASEPVFQWDLVGNDRLIPVKKF